MMTEDEFINKIENNYSFNSDELEALANDEAFETLDRISNGHGRWTEYITTIFTVQERYFAIDWQKGLTECQENFYYDQPYEVRPHEKVIVTTEWLPIKEEQR